MRHRREGCRTEVPRILLELQAPVHRDQRVVLSTHALQEVAVLQARPGAANDRIDAVVAVERRSELYRDVLVKKNAHEPRA
jgi:hypothetical protein